MQCKSCGMQIPDNSITCPNCGAQVAQDNQNQQYYNQSNQYSNPYNEQPGNNPYSEVNEYGKELKKQRKEFFRSYICDTPRRLVIAAAVLYFVSAAITFITALLLNPLTILDAILLVTLGVLVLVLKSRVVASLGLAYSLINTIFQFIMLRVFGGWLIIIASILAVIGTFMLHSNWAKYQKAVKEQNSVA